MTAKTTAQSDSAFAAAVARVQPTLAAWRKEVNAQGNKPNPNFIPAKYRELYIEVDPSRFDPAQAGLDQWEKMWAWRKGMNAVLPRAPNSKP